MTWRTNSVVEQLQLAPPLPPIVPTRLKDHACGDQSPRHEDVRARLRCNRPLNHEGAHQKIRASDFKVIAEWDDYQYRIFPPKN